MELLFAMSELANTMHEIDILANWATLKYDIEETQEAFVVYVDAPGIDVKNISITFKNDTLTINAKREQTYTPKYQERAFGEFSRNIKFYSTINEKSIKTSFKNGQLTIILPKGETQKINIDINTE